VVTGRKQAFCLEDSTKIDLNAGPAKYTCSYQGISVGWADTYSSYLDCQRLDITNVPPSDQILSATYSLRITINPERLLNELRYDNNTALIPVTIPSRIK